MKTICITLLTSVLLFSCRSSTNNDDHNHSYNDGHDHELNEFDNYNISDTSQQFFSIEGDSTILVN
jgi:hypothetical protein